MIWTKVNEWPWPLVLIKLHVLIQLTASTTFYIIDYNYFWKIHCFNFFPYKSIGNQIWHCRKIGQDQPRGIIWNKLGSTRVLDAAFQVSSSSAFWFREEDFGSFLAYMGMAAILVMWHKPFILAFILPSHEGSTWNMASIGLVFFFFFFFF